ncbi:cobalamin biosynthesis protein CbiX [Kitasatospora sp. NBC_01287]|uniref:sirohydrochlorin chelatase n=1 Tax=Kitasatospora sp. NBC_01287 TaxID=2903573 RepID=UPI00225822B8|nr:cobalamin biosynthesis protein CbiX [Kitasatospora sp. NBC_01287]MCX4744966.1 cobalamin biosynthesis protein CbiX [Kitasatospora sp. NBC_01287]
MLELDAATGPVVTELAATQLPATQLPADLILVGGHESGAGSRLRPLLTGDVRAGEVRAVGVGRELAAAVAGALAASERPVCVVPMTLGRDPRLVADTARTLRWLADQDRPGRIALCDPFGDAAHLIGWLRAAAGRTRATEPDETAVLVSAPAAGPFEDAELFRIARLVRQYRTHRWVEVAFEGGDPGIAEGVERCRRLGARQVVVLPAAFGPAPTAPGAEDGGPLLSARAVAGVLRARTAIALDRLRHGEDGIAAGLGAEHGHGFPHSHGHGPGHGHSHSHTRAHAPSDR